MGRYWFCARHRACPFSQAKSKRWDDAGDVMIEAAATGEAFEASARRPADLSSVRRDIMSGLRRCERDGRAGDHDRVNHPDDPYSKQHTKCGDSASQARGNVIRLYAMQYKVVTSAQRCVD